MNVAREDSTTQRYNDDENDNDNDDAKRKKIVGIQGRRWQR